MTENVRDFVINRLHAWGIRRIYGYSGDGINGLMGGRVGAMQMNGMNELIAIARSREEWADPRLVVLVLNNQDLNQVTWEQRVLAGDPKFNASQTLPRVSYAGGRGA